MSNPKNVIEMAKEIEALAAAELANTEHVYTLALKYLQQAYEWGADSIRNSSDYHQREDMGK